MCIISSLTMKHVIDPIRLQRDREREREEEKERLIQREIFFHGMKTPSELELPYCRRFTITLRHTTVGRKPLEERSTRHTDLNLRAHNNRLTLTHLCPGGIGNPNPSKRAAANPCLRPHRHWVYNGRYKKTLQLKYKTSASMLFTLYMFQ
jgi:hypothetical protein